ncbi:hypothetical protein ACKLNR_012676 [Fusarium oxysporum f. sp. zingiberi]
MEVISRLFGAPIIKAKYESKSSMLDDLSIICDLDPQNDYYHVKSTPRSSPEIPPPRPSFSLCGIGSQFC